MGKRKNSQNKQNTTQNKTSHKTPSDTSKTKQRKIKQNKTKKQNKITQRASADINLIVGVESKSPKRVVRLDEELGLSLGVGCV